MLTAQFNLGCYFEKGDVIPVDPGAAFYWFKQAAMQGDSRAQRRLAICYFRGIGTKKNDDEGLKWLTSAAEAGDHEAIKILHP